MDIRIVDGRLTKDAEVRVNKTNNKKFLTFTIANNGYAKGEQTTTYFNVVSYNEFDVNRIESLTKGKLVVVTGKPNEVMTIKDNKTYLNRNIMAHNIEMGTPSRDNTSTTTSYSDVAPVPGAVQPATVSAPIPTCEVPRVNAPTVASPTVATVQAPVAQTPVMPKPAASMPVNAPTAPYQASVYSETPNVQDDLPF
jgi:single-stranded DNA-binding protein